MAARYGYFTDVYVLRQSTGSATEEVEPSGPHLSVIDTSNRHVPGRHSYTGDKNDIIEKEMGLSCRR